MITDHSYTEATANFLGVCDPCQRPIRVTLTDHPGRFAETGCAECGQPVSVERLHAVITAEICDGRCMGATGPSCSCACGGTNHGSSFARTTTTYELESAVAAYREQQAALAHRRQVRLDRLNRERAAAFAEWAADHSDVITYLTDRRPVWSEFLADMAANIAAKDTLTDRQVDAVRRQIARDNDDAAFRATATTAPSGKAITVTGTVIQTMRYDSRYVRGKVDLVMVVETEGYRVRCPIPRILHNTDTHPSNLFGLRGRRLTFVADLVPSGKDAVLAYGKRLRDVAIVTP
jgi:hypothetical protein